MEENKKPVSSFLEPKYSLLRSLQTFCNKFNETQSEEKKQYPIIFTPNFIISGEIVLYTNIQETDEPNLYASKLIFQSSFLLPNKIIETDNTVEYTPKVLLMKNVTIISADGGNTTKLPAFNLFVDQVIGYSYGRIDNNS